MKNGNNNYLIDILSRHSWKDLLQAREVMRERMKNNIPARRLRENNNQQMKLILDQIKKLREENSQYKDLLAIVEDKVRMLQGDVKGMPRKLSE